MGKGSRARNKPISKPTFNREFAEARKKAGLAGLIFHDLRRTAARNMIRGGVPQSVAMRVTGHRSDSMFCRYDVASLDDKLEALRRAREYAATRAAVGGNVTPFPKDLSTLQPHIDENAGDSEGIWLAIVDAFRTQARFEERRSFERYRRTGRGGSSR